MGGSTTSKRVVAPILGSPAIAASSVYTPGANHVSPIFRGIWRVLLHFRPPLKHCGKRSFLDVACNHEGGGCPDCSPAALRTRKLNFRLADAWTLESEGSISLLLRFREHHRSNENN